MTPSAFVRRHPRPHAGPDADSARRESAAGDSGIPAGVSTFFFPDFPAPHLFTGRGAPEAAGLPPFGEQDSEATDRARLSRAISSTHFRTMRQVHGATVLVFASPSDPPSRPPDEPHAAPPPECDGLIATSPGEAAAVKTADCIPLLLHDERTGAAAAIHAGWRGAAAGIVDRALRALAETTGSPPTSFHAAIGPAIGPCCFEVGPEVLTAFAENGRNPADIRHALPPPADQPSSPPPRPHLDLPLDTRLRLLAAGLPESHLHEARHCTRCDPAFHSYRRSGPRAGRNWGVVLTAVKRSH